MLAGSNRVHHPHLRIGTTNQPKFVEQRVKKNVNATYCILMWVHVYFETILLAFAKHSYGIIHEFVVILSTGEHDGISKR